MSSKKFKFFILIIIYFFINFSINSLLNDISIYTKEEKEGTVVFYADNTNYSPFFITINFSELNNFVCSVDYPYAFVLPPKATKYKVLKIKIKNPHKSNSYRYQYSQILGDPDAKHDDSFIYIFPYQNGTKHKLVQGFNGKSTHRDENQYALDFDLNIGTPIAAARSGIVVDIKEDSDIGGFSNTYDKYGNYILILHPDGSFGNYVHLKKNGSIVKIGDIINQGDIIGYSGNTGRSSGPHLHFDVRILKDKNHLQSIPIKFLNYDGKAIRPVEGEYYYSTHPGKQSFDVVLGKNITNEDYDDYSVSIKKNDTIEIRSEPVDNTILVFIRNGYNKEIQITTQIDLINLQPSKNLPITIDIEPLTEKFLLFLRTIDNGAKTQWKASCQYKIID